MFEEPVRLLLDVFQKNRPVLDLLYANDTFVNPVLARHYGMPEPRRGDRSVGAGRATPTTTSAAACCRWPRS